MEKTLCRHCHHWSFAFTKLSLINSHAGSGRVTFVSKSTDLTSLLIMEILKITDFLPDYTTPHTQRDSITWAERAMWRLCQLLERILHWVSGQAQNISYTSVGNLPQDIPSVHFNTGEVGSSCLFLSTLIR